MAEGWRCTVCGQECSGGKFCLQCGAPRPAEGADAPAPEKRKDLTLAEARSELLPAGWLIEVRLSSSGSGMMMGSLHNREETLRWGGDGSVSLRIVDSRPYHSDKTSEYAVRPSEAEAVRELVLRENLAAWERLRELPPEPWGIPYDYSYSSSLQLQYENDGGDPAGTYSISPALAKRHGGGETLTELRELLDRCRNRGTLLSETETPGAYSASYRTMTGLAGTDGGSEDGRRWTCPSCGAVVGDHRFCPECGTPRPENAE